MFDHQNKIGAYIVFAVALLVLVVLLQGCASDEWGHHRTAPWTATQEWTFGTMAACNGLDAYQTSWGMNHGFAEGNPLLGSHPSDAKIAGVKSAMVGYAYLLEDQWESPQDRTAISIALLIGCGIVVGHNYSTERK